MKIKIDNLIEKYGIDCKTSIHLDIERKTEISFDNV